MGTPFRYENLKIYVTMANRRKKYKLFICVCVVLFLYYFFGLHDYVYSRNFEREFDYPLNIDIRPQVELIMSGKKPSVAPINYYPYRFLSNTGQCDTLERLDLLIIVKSAMKNLGHRNAIRTTFGQENVIPGRIVKTLFFLGIEEGYPKTELQGKIDEEMARYKDIIQVDFHDSYYNNTIKTMMSFRWVYEHCNTADFYLFTDDDMYISVPNVFDYIREVTPENDGDVNVYTGYVFQTTPQRFRTSKWRVSLEEYPWNKWPRYVTAGAYLVSNKSMKVLYAGSLFVKHFRFDDVYLGIVAKKVGLTPRHCDRFYFYKKRYDRESYRDVIASHGYDNHDELIRVWNEQNELRKLEMR